MSDSSGTVAPSGDSNGSGLADSSMPDATTVSSGTTAGSGVMVPKGPAEEGGAAGPVSCGLDIEAGAPLQADAGIAQPPNLATQYQGTFSSPPSLTDTNETPDGPLLGNGDVGVVVLGAIDAMTFILGKNEFWSLATSGVGATTTVKAMARLSVSIPGMQGASYAMNEEIGQGLVTGTFGQNGNTIKTTSWVQATDTTNNLFFTQYAYSGNGTQAVSVSLAVGHNNQNPTSVGSMGDVLYEDVAADNVAMVNGYPTRQVRVATRVIGTIGTVNNNTLQFTLSPGQTVTLASSIMSNVDSSSYQTQSIANVSPLTPSNIATDNTAHLAWWDAFHRMSYVEISDKTLEKEYYASLYLLASGSRANEAPPGLWGNWVMKDPAWNSDYTLNYNYEAPLYCTFPTNHLEQSDDYDAPVIAWLPKAQAEAVANGWTGAFYRVHIGPLPNGSADTTTHNQKSAGAFAATDMIMHYYYAPSLAYANSIYPTLKQMSTFWENYLVKDGNQYDIVNDAQQEDDPSPQTNGIMSLGLVRFLLQATIDVSTALNVDADERASWQNKLTNLAPFPTYTSCPGCQNGETVFRYTSVGRDWCPGNTIGIQHIYPASQIGLSSEASLLQIANNMIDAMGRWSDGNGTNTFYPAADRVGYNPTKLLSELDSWIQNNTYPNLHIHTGGGGLENLNTVPATVAEMLLQSFQGTIRVFPDWPTGTTAKFANLRAYGGFLVSSAIKDNAIPYVRVVSEDGGPFTLSSPWSGEQMVVYRNGVDVGTLSGTSATIQSCAGDSIVLAPQGSTYASVISLVNSQ